MKSGQYTETGFYVSSLHFPNFLQSKPSPICLRRVNKVKYFCCCCRAHKHLESVNLHCQCLKNNMADNTRDMLGYKTLSKY